MKNLDKDLKLLAGPILVLIILVVLFLISGKIIFDNMNRLNNNLNSENNSLKTLQQKLNSLSSVNETTTHESQIALLALPSSNSIFPAISLIQSQANNLNLLIVNIQATNLPDSAKQGVNSSQIDFEVSGDYSSIVSFINNIKNSTPLIHFGEIKIDNSQSVYSLTATVFSFWAPLPATLPQIDKPIEMLTSDEQKTLAAITPNIVSPITSSSSASPTGKINPFQ
ncbi:MAG TPA: type 4a pilus biogenesis protein PilO [Patescibacteria group bacterium]|nr:type 4a pilus biogenesis protein PilO [Patescibacteria group bacterium]